MARGFGLRARLIGGGGGMPQVGFLGGVAQGINNITQQMAQAQDPAYQQALQLQRLKMQAAQNTLEAQQQERESIAGFQRLGEEAFPAGGRTQEVDLGGQEPEQAPVTMPQTTPLSLNERLQKALIQSGNLRALADIQHQLTPQSEANVVDLGGGQRGIRQPGGNITPLPTIQPKEPQYGQVFAERMAEEYHIPVSQANSEQLADVRNKVRQDKDNEALQRFREQKQIAISMASIGKDDEPMSPTNSYYNRTTGDKMTVPTKGDYKRNRDKIAVLSSKDADNYDLLATAQPNLDMIRNVLPKILQGGGGGQNLSNAFGLWLKRVGGSSTQLAQFDMTRNFLITMMARVETGGVRPPVVLIKMVRDQLPLDRNNVNAALQEISIMEREIKNRQGTMIGNKPQALPDITQQGPTVTLGGQTYRRQ